MAAICFLIAYIIVPWLYQSQPPAQIELLRKQERSIRAEFAAIQDNLLRRARMAARSWPKNLENVHRWLLSLPLDPETEGVIYFRDDQILLWHGQTIPPALLPLPDEATHIVRYKASTFLATTFSLEQKEKVAWLRLLSFSPTLSPPFLRPYTFLKERENAVIDFYEDEEDVSGLERIFARHQDEYISQPRSRTDILTIFFPLRNEKARILATVNLRSLSSPSLLYKPRKNWQIAGWIALSAAFLSLTGAGISWWWLARYRSLKKLFPCLAGLVGTRFSLLQLGRLTDSSSPLLSPAAASLPFPGGLLSSPLDIFLSLLTFGLILLLFLLSLRHLVELASEKNPSFWLKAIGGIISLASVLPFYGFSVIAFLLTSHSQGHLLDFYPFFPSLLLFLSLASLLGLAFFLSFFIFRTGQKIAANTLPFWFPLLSLAILFFLLSFLPPKLHIVNCLFLSLLLSGFYLTLIRCRGWRGRAVRFLVFALAVAFFHLTLHLSIQEKEKNITEGFLRESILSQDEWAQYLLESSLPVLDKEEETILDFLQQGKEGPLARFLWEKTSLARWNWYSSLELIDQNGFLLSRFSLNVPLLFRPKPSFPLSEEWSLFRTTLPFPGREKDFVVGCRQFKQGEKTLGHLVLYVLLDEEMYTLLYAPVPYFDLLRYPSVSSLRKYSLGLAVFRPDGKIVFNPNKLTVGIPPEDLQRLVSNREEAFWSSLADRRRVFRVFYFWNQDKIIALLWPKPNLISLAADYLRIFFPLLALVYLLLFISDLRSGRRRLATYFWAFSSRVYASFVAIVLILLLPISFLLQGFFSRIASEHFNEKAEIQARVARNIMEDFLFFQAEESSASLPVEDLVLWVSTAIANDVTIYQDGRMLASSRQEFFDSGILPDYLDGEAAYLLTHEKYPYLVWTKKIGSYSFQTITIPLHLNGSFLLISLPFPLEQQEIGRFQEELIEFFIFILALSLLLIFLFARSIGGVVITPIRKLLVATREVSAGNLEVFIEHHGRDEMQTLIDGFNRMVAGLKQHERELAEMSKKAAWAEMARKVAHEVKNPLTPIRLSAEHLLRVYEERPEEFRTALQESVAYIIGEVENLRQIAQEFLAISREGPGQRAMINLSELIKEISLPYERVLAGRIDLARKIPREVCIEGDPDKLKIALRNVLINAVEAIRGKGKIIIAVKEENGVIIEIKDTGEGMDKNTLARVFEPDFSTKDLGTGLGLPIAKKIVEDLGGKITIESELGRGTTVRLFFPSSRPSPS